MAEPKKKTATKKSSTKKAAPKKSPSKKTTAAPKKTTAPKKVVAAPLTKTVTKPTTKKVSTKKTVKASAASFTKELIPESVSTKKDTTDMSIFATILAVFVVALVVLGGYIYSRQVRMADEPVPTSAVSEPQKISISSSVNLTPEVISVLESLVTQIAIAPEEVLLDVRKIEDVAVAQSESADFFRDVQSWDFVFEFQSTSVLFRPSTKQIITTGILPKEPS